MKASSLFVAFLVLVVVSGAACGGGSDASGDAADSPDTGEVAVGFGSEADVFVGSDVISGSQPFSTSSQFQANPPGITVIATGTAKGEPDAAFISVPIGSDEAFYPGYPEFDPVGDEAIDEIVSFLRDEGVPEADIVVDKYASSSFGYPGGGAARIAFRWEKLDSLDELVKDLQSVTRQQTEYELIEPVIWFISDECQTLEDEAAKSALEDAHDRADRLAEEAGLSLGPVISVAESVFDPYGLGAVSACPGLDELIFMLPSYGPASSTPSSITVSSSLTVTYSIE